MDILRVAGNTAAAIACAAGSVSLVDDIPDYISMRNQEITTGLQTTVQSSIDKALRRTNADPELTPENDTDHQIMEALGLLTLGGMLAIVANPVPRPHHD